MTATAQGRPLTCDYAGCSAPASVEHEAWVFCALHGRTAATDALPAKTTPRPPSASRPRPTPLAAVPSPAAAPAITSVATLPPAPPAPAPTAVGTEGSPVALLEQAARHSNPKVTRLAARVVQQLDDLRALITADAEQEGLRQAQAAQEAEARAEIERLEAALAAARAKLPATPAKAKRKYTLSDAERLRRSEAAKALSAKRKAERAAAQS